MRYLNRRDRTRTFVERMDIVSISTETRFSRPVIAAGMAAVLFLGGSGTADARPGISVEADTGTWGTALASNGRAQRVNAVVEVDGTAYLGGAFTKMTQPGGGSTVGRSRLAAVDTRSGALHRWNPKANGTVRALEVNAGRTAVYVGGDFSAIGGISASKLALVDLASGRIDRRFRSAVRGRVRTIVLAGGTLYVGGDFTSVGGKTRAKVAALDPVTGTLLDWAPPALGGGRYLGNTGVPTPSAPSGNVYALAVPPDGGRVYVAGDFLDIAGHGGLVVLDGVSGEARPQQWAVGRPVFDLTVSPADGRTVFAAAGGAGGRIYAFHPDRPTKPRWSAAVDGDAVGVAASTTKVFLMGHYDYVIPKGSTCYQFCPNGTHRRHLAAFDASTGALDGWNPRADTSTGPVAAAVTDDGLLVVGEFTRINGDPRRGYARFAFRS